VDTELLKEVAPNINRVIFLPVNPNTPYRRAIEAAAQSLGMQVLTIPIANGSELPPVNHYKRLHHQTKHVDVELAKSNILLIGPTGSGKTLLAQPSCGEIAHVYGAAKPTARAATLVPDTVKARRDAVVK
jgi:hypothetical protein